MREELWHLLAGLKMELGVIWLFVIGSIGRLFVSSKPISVRIMIGEALLSIVMAVGLLSYAEMAAWSPVQTVGAGALASFVGRLVLLRYLEKKVL